MAATLPEALAGVPLCRGLEPGELATLATCIRRRDLPHAGQVLFEAGHDSDAAYIVRRGLLVVELPLASDEALEVARLGPDTVVGELCLVREGPRSLRVRALEPTSLWRIDRARFAALRAAGDPAAYKLLRNICVMLCDRLRTTTEFIESELRQEAWQGTETGVRERRGGLVEAARRYLGGLLGR